jgi:hypothetical protein
MVNAAAHMSSHTPATHWWPGLQRVPQVPQLVASFCKLTQRPPQLAKPL